MKSPLMSHVHVYIYILKCMHICENAFFVYIISTSPPVLLLMVQKSCTYLEMYKSLDYKLPNHNWLWTPDFFQKNRRGEAFYRRRLALGLRNFSFILCRLTCLPAKRRSSRSLGGFRGKSGTQWGEQEGRIIATQKVNIAPWKGSISKNPRHPNAS